MPTQDEQDYKDYQDYLDYQKHLQGSAPAQGGNLLDRLSENYRNWKSKAEQEEADIASGKIKRPDPIEGSAPMVLPGGAIPALTGLATKLAGSSLGRMGASTAVGAVTGALKDPGQGSRLDNALDGAKTGAAFGAGGELIGAGAGLVKNIGRGLARFTKPQAQAYLDRPGQVSQIKDMLENGRATPELQDAAADTINQARRSMKTTGLQNAGKLRELLTGKTVSVNPKDYLGIDPETDAQIMGKVQEGLDGYAKSSPHNNMPDSIDLDANEANALKQKLQGMSRYKPGTVMDPVQEAKNAAAATKAQSLRAQLETLDQGVKPLNDQMQEGALVSSDLRKGLKKPIAYVSSQSPDRIATMGRAEGQGAQGLQDFGDSLGAAKRMAEPDHGSGIPTFTGKLAGRAALKAGDVAQKTGRSAGMLSQLLQMLSNGDSNK